MLEQGKISGTQLSILIVLFLAGTTVLIPTGTEAKKDVWLVLIISTFWSIFLASIYAALIKGNPGKTVIEILSTLLGPLLGKSLGLIYVFFFLHLSALIVRNLSDFMATVLPETPLTVFAISYILLAIYATRNGIEIIGRAATWSIVIFLAIVGANVFFLTPDMNLENMLPILEEGYKPILQGLLSASGFPFGELVLFLMVIPYINSYKSINKSLYTGVSAFGILILILTLRNISVLGIELLALHAYPSFVTVQYAQIGGFWQNLAPLFMMAFLVSIFIKLTVCFYAGTLGLAQLFNLKDYKALTLPLGLIVVTLSVLAFENLPEQVAAARRIYPLYILPLSLFIPVLLLLIQKLKPQK